MKIGIITFHRADNYGAIFQTYSLQRFISENICDCQVIDYYSDEIERKSKFPNKKNYNSLSTYFKSVLMFFIYCGRHKKFELFRNKMNLSNKYLKNDLIKTNEIFDSFITGSDQVWNWNCTKGDTAYFLDFVSANKKKNSYAASFAISEIPVCLQKDYYSLLNNFNSISVREKKGVEIVSNLLKREAVLSIDPTFLLSLKDWKKLAIMPKTKKKYILIYQLTVTESLIDFAKKLSKKTHYSLIIIPNSFKYFLKAKYLFKASPEEWLGLFYNAQYIITNTFHGVAFSIIMNKPFFVEVLANINKTTSRIENILDAFNLQDRKIDNRDLIHFDKKIDWDIINEKINCERKKSLIYLSSLCAGSNNNNENLI